MTKTFDPESFSLAEYFLAEYPAAARAIKAPVLAGVIQQAIEDWFEDEDQTAESMYDHYIDSKIDEYRETGIRPSVRRRTA